jgi:hypothetical protein
MSLDKDMRIILEMIENNNNYHNYNKVVYRL